MSPQWFQTLKDVRRNKPAEEAWESLVVEEREIKIRMAKVLEAIHRAKHYVVRGCASIGEYVEKYGYSAQYGRDLVGTGKLMKRSARVEPLLRESRLSIQAAGVIERVMAEVPGAVLDDWLDVALRTSTRALIQLAMEALETFRMGGGPLKTRILRLSPTGDREFEHAKSIARRRAEQPLTDSEANERFVRCYIDRYDPDWRDLGKHRVRGIRAAANPKSRWIPAAVKREVRLRDGDKCSVPFCDHKAWIAYAHATVSYADGGTNGTTNIFLLCHFHNWMMVDGYLKVGGTADDPLFTDKDGLPYVPLGWTREQTETLTEERLSVPRRTVEEILETDRRLAADDPKYKDRPG